jgi:acetyltransferase
MSYFFSPNSVAVIGATDHPGSVGWTVVRNLMNGSYQGRVYLINPRRDAVGSWPCVPALASVPDQIDLAVVVTPAATVPRIVEDCVRAQTKSIVVISAGFKEKGEEGVQLEQQIRQAIHGSQTRVIGPNCLGLMNPLIGLNATFAQEIARPGSVAFLSQSGALLTAILDWSFSEQVGFSGIVSTGSMLDVSWGDLLSHYGMDPQTKSILLYMESIGDARAFMSAAREVSFEKPIIVIKAGRSEAAARAAASHTGAMTGSDAVYDAAFRRSGVLRVQNIAELFHMADVLGKQPLPSGPRLTIVTNAGGPGVLATDALLSGSGELAELSTESERALSAFLPPHWSHANPIDILGDASPERYEQALKIALDDANSDGLLAILAPQGMTNPTEVATRLATSARANGKPLLASWMGGQTVLEGRSILGSNGIPAFSYPDAAVRSFELMWAYTERLQSLYETPSPASDPVLAEERRKSAAVLLDRVASSGRTLLTEFEAKKILQIYEIPTVPTAVAAEEDDAVLAAERIGYPVVLKLHSETITHKTDVGGVQLNLQGAPMVKAAFQKIKSALAERGESGAFLGVTVQPMVRLLGNELILGSSVDAQFGPVLLFGSGGQLVEVYRDRAVGLPPLNTTLARRLMEQTKVFRALHGVRGRKAIDLGALESMLVRFSELVMDHPRLREIDINPLLASPEKLLALDARMVLFAEQKDLPHSAIRPYPVEYVSTFQMKDGTGLTFRPIRAEDEPLLTEFHKELSDRTVYLRYLQVRQLDSRIAHERLIRKCFLDYDREIALVAERRHPNTGPQQLLAVGRLSRTLEQGEVQIAVLVADQFQRGGIGGELVRRLIAIAKREGYKKIVASILGENAAMLALARHFQFTCIPDEDGRSLTARLNLEAVNV